MYRYTCLNPIAEVGLNRFSEDYGKTDDIKEADAVLVRSANMHEMELPDTLQAIARAGAQSCVLCFTIFAGIKMYMT